MSLCLPHVVLSLLEVKLGSSSWVGDGLDFFETNNPVQISKLPVVKQSGAQPFSWQCIHHWMLRAIETIAGAVVYFFNPLLLVGSSDKIKFWKTWLKSIRSFVPVTAFFDKKSEDFALDLLSVLYTSIFSHSPPPLKIDASQICRQSS